MGRKEGAAEPLYGAEEVGPSNTMWPGPRSTTTPSGILIHPVIRSHQSWGHGPKIGGLGPYITQCGLG